MKNFLALLLVASACGGSAEPVTAANATVTSTTTMAATTAPPTTGSTMPATTEAPSTTEDDVFLIEITVAGGEVTVIAEGAAVELGGRIDVPLGSQVMVIAQGDPGDEVHVHAYDHHADFTPGETGVAEFVADIPGVFEVELEDAGTLLFHLEVS